MVVVVVPIGAQPGGQVCDWTCGAHGTHIGTHDAAVPEYAAGAE